jgi:dynein light intermediate chain 1
MCIEYLSIVQSDAQMTLEQTLDYKDEQFDFIQQTLRCICMKCKF